MEKVIVGVSDEASQSAVDWVIERSQRRPLSVTLVRAFDVLMADAVDIEDELSETTERIRRLSPRTLVQTEAVTTSIPEALIPASESADLLVIGSHHHHYIQSALTGAVPMHLAAKAECATVIVPDDWHATFTGRIVAGFDDDGSSGPALEFAAEEALASGAELDVLHAWSVPVTGLEDIQALGVSEQELRTAHHHLLSAAAHGLEAIHPGVKVREVLREESAATALADAAQQADLIVVGSHRWGPVSGLIAGSTARETLRLSSTPLCIVPGPDARARRREARAGIRVGA